MEFFVIPFFVMLGPVLIVLMLLRYRFQQTQERYRTLLQLAEKGVDLPQQLLVEQQLPYSERRRALLLISAGLGLMAMFVVLPGHVSGLWATGILPLMIGLGYLASWWLNRRESGRD